MEEHLQRICKLIKIDRNKVKNLNMEVGETTKWRRIIVVEDYDGNIIRYDLPTVAGMIDEIMKEMDKHGR